MYTAYLKKMPDGDGHVLFVIMDDINHIKSEYSSIRVAPYTTPLGKRVLRYTQLNSSDLYTIPLTKNEVIADLAECPTVLGEDLEDILKSIQVLGLL